MTVYVTENEYFAHMISMGFVPSFGVQVNSEKFLLQVNNMLTYIFQNKLFPLNFKPILSSGWRSEAWNKQIGGAPLSSHVTGQAADFSSTSLCKFLEGNVYILEKFDLYLESSVDTSVGNGHTHLQSIKTKSGFRVFRA